MDHKAHHQQRNCGNCGSEAATIQCTACALLLCDNCDSAVHSLRAFSSHSRITISEASLSNVCHKHVGMPLSTFCLKCKEVCCKYCFVDEHDGHRSEPCEKAAARLTKKAASYLGRLTEATASAESDLLRLSEAIALNQRRKGEAAAYIDEAFARLSSLVESKREEAHADLNAAIAATEDPSAKWRDEATAAIAAAKKVIASGKSTIASTADEKGGVGANPDGIRSAVKVCEGLKGALTPLRRLGSAVEVRCALEFEKPMVDEAIEAVASLGRGRCKSSGSGSVESDGRPTTPKVAKMPRSQSPPGSSSIPYQITASDTSTSFSSLVSVSAVASPISSTERSRTVIGFAFVRRTPVVSVMVSAAWAIAMASVSRLGCNSPIACFASSSELLKYFCSTFLVRDNLIARLENAVSGSQVAESLHDIALHDSGTDDADEPVNNDQSQSVDLPIDPIADNGGIEAVLTQIARFHETAGVVEQGLWALVTIASTGRSAARVAELGGIEATLRAMRAFRKNPEIQQAACGVLRNVSATYEEAVHVASTGGIDAIVVALKSHPMEVRVAFWGCGAICNVLSSSALFKHYGTPEAIDAVRRAARSFSKKKALQLYQSVVMRVQHPAAIKAQQKGVCLLSIVPRCSAPCGAFCDKCVVVAQMWSCHTCDGRLSDKLYCAQCWRKCHSGHTGIDSFSPGSCDCLHPRGSALVMPDDAVDSGLQRYRKKNRR